MELCRVDCLKNRNCKFPYENWQKELKLLSNFGFNCIEWLIDKRDDDKNIFFDKNFTFFKNEQEIKNILIRSVCLHYFIDNPINFDDAPKNYSFTFLESILSICCINNINNIIFPISDELLKFKGQQLACFFERISRLKFIKPNIRILFEVDSEFELSINLIDRLNKNFDIFGLCYDLGNANYHGRSIIYDFKLLNKYIYEIHIKDKDKLGNNVYLGKGNVKFEEFKTEYPKLGKLNNIIFETNTYLDPLDTMKKNVKFMRAFL